LHQEFGQVCLAPKLLETTAELADKSASRSRRTARITTQGQSGKLDDPELKQAMTRSRMWHIAKSTAHQQACSTREFTTKALNQTATPRLKL